MRINNTKKEINMTITYDELEALNTLFKKTEKCTSYVLLEKLKPIITSINQLHNDHIKEELIREAERQDIIIMLNQLKTISDAKKAYVLSSNTEKIIKIIENKDDVFKFNEN